MTQLAIDFAAVHCRAADPITSADAAERAAAFAPTQARRILHALVTHGPRTAHELGQIVGLTVVQVDRRLPDLKAAGKARVVQLDDGADKVVDGFRVWEAI